MRTRRTPTALAAAAVLSVAIAGTAAAHNPPGDPLPVNGEPDCFGSRISHGASQHGLTPTAKLPTITYLVEVIPEAFPPLTEFFVEHGISVRSVQLWVRTNCSDDPIIANP